jgi:hypothetical protein
LGDSDFRNDPLPLEMLFHESDAAELQIFLVDESNCLGAFGVDDQAAIHNIVTERRVSSHRHAFAFRGSDLVADAFAGNLAFELGERQQHVQCQPAMEVVRQSA